MIAALANASMARHSASFSRAARLLSPGTRAEIENLYCLCRAIDDAADVQTSDADATILPTLAQALRQNAAHPWLAQVDQLSGHALTRRRCLLRLTQSCIEDALAPRLIADEQALLRYAYGVAGTVGLMLLPLLGVQAASGAPSRHACALGMAMQLSNIARDVVQDAGLGRVYLPQTWRVAMLSLPALAQAEASALQACVPAQIRLLALAEVLYRAGLSGLGHIPLRNRFAVALAALMYREIGRKIQRELPTLGFARRTVVSRAKKAWLAAQALVLSVRAPRVPVAAELDTYVLPWLQVDGFNAN
jgi:15-cis-phytoene synthase